jgi:hypothetical protein
MFVVFIWFLTLLLAKNKKGFRFYPQFTWEKDFIEFLKNPGFFNSVNNQ